MTSIKHENLNCLYTHSHESTNPKRTDTVHTHGSVDGDFDAVKTMVLCDDVINDNDEAPRPEVMKPPICTVHQCSVRGFIEKIVDFRRNCVYYYQNIILNS